MKSKLILAFLLFAILSIASSDSFARSGREKIFGLVAENYIGSGGVVVAPGIALNFANMFSYTAAT